MTKPAYKIIQLISREPDLLFDGSESSLPAKFSISKPGVNTALTLKYITSHFLEDVLPYFDKPDIESIVDHPQIKKIFELEFETYVDLNGIDVYATIQTINGTTNLLIFSFGETQPGRYQLYLLSIWQIQHI